MCVHNKTVSIHDSPFSYRHTIQYEQLTHTLNMTLRNTQYIGALAPKAPNFFSGDLEGEEGWEVEGLDPGGGGGPHPYSFFYSNASLVVTGPWSSQVVAKCHCTGLRGPSRGGGGGGPCVSLATIPGPRLPHGSATTDILGGGGGGGGNAMRSMTGDWVMHLLKSPTTTPTGQGNRGKDAHFHITASTSVGRLTRMPSPPAPPQAPSTHRHVLNDLRDRGLCAGLRAAQGPAGLRVELGRQVEGAVLVASVVGLMALRQELRVSCAQALHAVGGLGTG